GCTGSETQYRVALTVSEIIDRVILAVVTICIGGEIGARRRREIAAGASKRRPIGVTLRRKCATKLIAHATVGEGGVNQGFRICPAGCRQPPLVRTETGRRSIPGSTNKKIERDVV